MKLIDGYWVDDNNNKWNSKKYTEQYAQMARDSLVSCHDCIDCHDCGDSVDCYDCHNCWSCNTCSCCWTCDNCWTCDDCMNCNSLCNASNYISQPIVYSTLRMGSHEDITRIYHGITENGLSTQVVCGCFCGDLDEFEEAVNRTHGNNEHGVAYREVISKARMLFGLEN